MIETYSESSSIGKSELSNGSFSGCCLLQSWYLKILFQNSLQFGAWFMCLRTSFMLRKLMLHWGHCCDTSGWCTSTTIIQCQQHWSLSIQDCWSPSGSKYGDLWLRAELPVEVHQVLKAPIGPGRSVERDKYWHKSCCIFPRYFVRSICYQFLSQIWV